MSFDNNNVNNGNKRFDVRSNSLGSRIASGAVRDEMRLACVERVKQRRAEHLQRVREKAMRQQRDEYLFYQYDADDDNDDVDLRRVCADLFPSLSADEYLELQLQVEESLRVDVETERFRLLLQSAREFDDAALAATVDAPELSPLSCPICRVGNVQVAHGVVFCQCGLRINTHGERVELDAVQRLLCEAVDGHAQVCDAPPQFVVQDQFGLQALYFQCDRCAALVLLL
jgi:hypothetical protein